MKAYFEVEQLSIEWFTLKWGKIGGTRSKGLFIKSDNLLLELLAEHTEDFDKDSDEEGFISDAMDRGISLEPQARLELSKYTGIDFMPVGWIDGSHELFGVSPDGVSEDLRFGCEIKCPGAKKHLSNCMGNSIPLDHINQCVHNFAVNEKLEKFYFMSYRPESIKPLFVCHITRDCKVNIGTSSRPVIKTVSDIVDMEIAQANILQEQITESINKLKF